jgi:CBS domain containing-hemolysin-like protein
MSELGRIPKTGDQVEVAGGRLVVLKMEARRVDRIKFEPVVEKDD